MPDTVARLNSALEGRYRLERHLGEGGMATVYLADDLRHERKVALKVLKPELAAVVGAERFLAEIKTTANLQHPHILPLFDSGEADGFLFYVMPYVEGETLRDRLDRERQLPIPDAVRIAEGMAEALDYAHQRGVVHRDIKPANVLLHGDRPVIADFGIALAVNTGSGARLTETGLSLGTPHYMSPEQATGEQRVGPATDIYALGCVLYEMLVGSPPYTGGTAQAVLGQILLGDVKPVTDHRATVPSNIAAAVRCALEKVPADRFGSGEEFTRALRDPSFRYGTDWRGTGSGSRWNSLTVVLASAVILLLVYIGIFGRRGGDPDPRVNRYVLSLGVAPGLPVRFGGGVRISPDGSSLAYIGPTEEGGRAVYLKEASELTPRRLDDLYDPLQMAFSPDGTQLAGISTIGSGLAVLSLATGQLTVLADSGVWAGDGDWGDDDWIYVQGDRGTIVRYSPEAGTVEDVTELEAGEVEHLFPEVLPGGGSVLFTVWHTSPEFEGAQIAVTEVGSRTHRVIAQGNRAFYSHTGHLLLLRSDGSVHAAPFDARRLEVTGPVIPLFDGVTIGQYAGFDFSLSEAGDLVYSGLGEGQIGARELVWVDRDGNERPLDEDWAEQFESVAISPEGNRIAVTIGTEEQTTIWLKALSGGPAARFTFTGGLNRRPVWTPDGDDLLFISDRGEDRALYSKPADGTGSALPVLDLPRHVDQASRRSPEGWRVYRTGISGQERDIFAIRAGADSVEVPVSAGQGVDEHSPTLSPDGRYVAYVSDEGGEEQVWVRPFPDVAGGRWLVSPGGGVEPVWGRDGEELFFRGGGSLIAVRVQTEPAFAVTGIDTLFSARQYFLSNVHPAYDVSPDGERFLMIRAGAPDVHELIVVENFAEELERRIPR